MLISYSWLQSYFKEKLPSPEKVAELLIFHAFEVESIEKKGNDAILDVKVLPDRAHDALSHRGIAKELSVHLNSKIKNQKSKLQIKSEKLEDDISISIEEPNLCRRYVGRKILGVKVGHSPQWLIERLESIGQKSINNVVDATNFVMFDLGQPLHAFDALKVDSGIIVRNAEKGEKITTLDGKEVALDGETLIIADGKSALAIAGIKGGKKAEINSDTTNIILEAANFSPVNIRKTSRRLGIQTDSSKRFENEQSPEGVEEAMEKITALVVEVAGGKDTKVGDVVDIYPRKPAPYVVGVSTEEVNRILGTNISEREITSILSCAEFSHRGVSSPIKEVLGRATTLIDVPYKFGASIVYDAPRAFDCSSFIAYLFAQAGVQIPRMAVDQYAYGEAVSEKELEPGDLVFSNTGAGKIYYETVEFMKGIKIPEGVDHCGLYMGNGNVIHATRATGKVVMESMSESSPFKNIMGYRRIHEALSPRLVVTVPYCRLDVRIKEDLVEEIGKAYGYDKILPKQLPQFEKIPAINKEFYYTNKIKNILIEEGFSEIYTSSFTDTGDVAVENPIAGDKGFLRSNLSDGLTKSLEINIKNAPLLQVDVVKVFEIGKVFEKKGESLHLAFGIRNTLGYKGDKAFEAIKKVCMKLSHELGQKLKEHSEHSVNEAITQIDFDELLTGLPESKSYEHTLKVSKKEAVYKKISSYPFVLRDIAIFVPAGVVLGDISSIIKEHAGELLAREPKLFDRFEKKNKETGAIEKISYAFQLVFQSGEKTLTDGEVNTIMQNITDALNNKSTWRVR
ncbi:MAG: phenylalanine--tRNA ligase beta subunit-related protein [bacterium]|nr:phenylalanine--tRNA ligase beta subunit-related protein [bacterium]